MKSLFKIGNPLVALLTLLRLTPGQVSVPSYALREPVHDLEGKNSVARKCTRCSAGRTGRMPARTLRLRCRGARTDAPDPSCFRRALIRRYGVGASSGHTKTWLPSHSWEPGLRSECRAWPATRKRKKSCDHCGTSSSIPSGSTRLSLQKIVAWHGRLENCSVDKESKDFPFPNTCPKRERKI